MFPTMKSDKILLVLLFIIQSSFVFAIEQASEERLDEVATKGRSVMPFNLEKTLHVFTKTEQGGVQQVIVKNPQDDSQITLIQSHLDKIYQDFKQRDFSDPEKIHGQDMPGLKALRESSASDIVLQYRQLKQGAEITYTTKKPELIKAIHLWFDAQLSDHARHSSMHQLHHKMMHQ